MPGPRLEARLSNPQPIVSQNGPNPIAQLAPLIAGGMKLYEQYQDGEDDKFLLGVDNEAQKIQDAKDQGLITDNTATIQLRKLYNEASNNQPHLLSRLKQAGRFSAAGVKNTLDSKTIEQDRITEQREKKLERAVSFGIDPEQVGWEDRYQESLRISNIYISKKMENDAAEQAGILDKADMEVEAYALAGDWLAKGINSWASMVGTSEATWNSRDPADNVAKVEAIDKLLRVATLEIQDQYAGIFNKDEQTEMLRPLLEEAEFVKGLISGTRTLKEYKNRQTINEVMAANIEAPTPQDLVLKRKSDDLLNSRNPELWLNLVGTPGLRKVLKQYTAAWLSRSMGDKPSDGLTARDMIKKDKDKAIVYSSLWKEFTKQGLDAPEELSTMLSNMATAGALDPNDVGMEEWDAMVGYAASDRGKADLAKGTFTVARDTIGMGLANYATLLLNKAKDKLPEGVAISILNGILSIKDDGSKPKYIPSRMISSTSLRMVKANAIEKWRQNYGTRINTLAQAGVNVKGIPLDESIRALATFSSLITADLNITESSFDEEYARELVDMGLADNMAEALSIIRSN